MHSGLFLNINKCKSMSFTKRHSPYIFYSINGTVFTPVDSEVSGLGFFLVPSLCPRAHIDHITCKANEVLGFLM